MSAIQNLHGNEMRFRSYSYTWGDSSSMAKDTTTVKIGSYTFRGLTDVQLPKLIMLVSMQQACAYEEKLVCDLENLQQTTEILHSASVAAEILAKNVMTTGSIDTSASANQVRFLQADGTQVTYTIPDFMRILMGCTDVSTNTWWDTVTCEKMLNSLLDAADKKNRISEDKAMEMESTVSYLSLANNFGIDTVKLLLHASRNLSGNL